MTIETARLSSEVKLEQGAFVRAWVGACVRGWVG